jgi:pyruvate, water dikinase
MADSYIKWLSDLNKDSGMVAGGKGANLAEMFNAKFPVPPAFIITTDAYRYFVTKSGIKEKIDEILDSIDVDNTSELQEKSKEIRKIMMEAKVPQDLKSEILEAYDHLSVDKSMLRGVKSDALSILKRSQEPVFVAVRSSATTEDLADSSFAGQQETYLNVKGNHDLIEKVKVVLSSLFTARAIYYRKKRGFSKEKFALAAVVQKMIDSDKSGVMFSKNPIKNNDHVLIEAVFGLGEGIVSGKINPDSYEVDRELKIIKEEIGEKKIAITRNSSGETSEVKLTPERSNSKVLTEGQIKQLANFAIKIEKHYKKPQDIEYAIENNEIFITQSRPITTKVSDKEQKEISGEVLLTGLGASPGVGAGKVKIIHSLEELNKVEKGDILVTKMTNPDMVVSMQKADGIITDEGGVTSHAAIVSREMGIPAVVGVGNATSTLKDGDLVTVDGTNGKIYQGESEEKKVEILPIIEGTKTKIKVIVDVPEAAPRAALTKCSDVGLLRLEGIIATGKKHPLKYEADKNLDEYIKILESGVSEIVKHFKEVWIRSSDIRTDEFENLEGAPEKEGNPMLGDHGIRFSLKHPEILKAEFQVVKNIVEKNPDKVMGIMFPQIISVEEVEKAKEIANSINLLENKNVKLGVMVETPSSALIIKDLLKTGVQFVSFGTNDLTQYVLAIDRNNAEVQHIFNETNPAVLNAIKRVLRTCTELGVESSICGQAGSKKDMAKFLVENNINSISVNADAAHEISKYVKELESSNPMSKEKQTTQDIPPKLKIKQIERKAEMAMAAEIMSNRNKPKQIPQQPINVKQSHIPEPNNPNPEPIEKKKEKVPAYVANTIQNNDVEDRNLLAIKQLFEGLNVQKMESETNKSEDEPEEPEMPEPIQKSEDNDEDEVMDIF